MRFDDVVEQRWLTEDETIILYRGVSQIRHIGLGLVFRISRPNSGYSEK